MRRKKKMTKKAGYLKMLALSPVISTSYILVANTNGKIMRRNGYENESIGKKE